jgi:VWFA-related protein
MELMERRAPGRLGALAVVVLLAAAGASVVLASSDRDPVRGHPRDVLFAQQTQPPTFRSAVDVIAVDVQVVDKDGRPVLGLTPDKFEVTIEGRRRRVVSADLVDYSRTAADAETSARPTLTTAMTQGRVILIAIDCLSISSGVAQSAIVAAKNLISHLPADDFVGLFVYPVGPQLAPTTNHAAVAHAVESLIPQLDAPMSTFHLNASDIIDLSTLTGGGSAEGEALDLVTQLCGGDPNCAQRLRDEVLGLVIYYEGEGYASLEMFRTWLKSLVLVPGAKTVVLISGGLIAADIPGARPNLNELGIAVGKSAAQSNVRVYTMFLDQGWREQMAAETRNGRLRMEYVERESTIRERWLDEFSGGAGGSLLKVLAGNGEAAVDRILSETSAYYLLGVQPDEADRDGRAHSINVKVSQRSVTVRGRTWVMIPSRNTSATPVTAAATTSTPTAPDAAAPASPPPVVAPDVIVLGEAYERSDYASLQALVRDSRKVGQLIHDFRDTGGPWPEAPRRSAVVALELARSGLSSADASVRDDAGRLLVQMAALIRQPGPPDQFECSWHWAELAAVEGMNQPAIAQLFVTRALQRCPNESRFHLSEAVIADQRAMRAARGPVAGQAAPLTLSDSEQASLLHLYEQAMGYAETSAEARLRAAWVDYRLGYYARALTRFNPPAAPPADPAVRYWQELVRGQVLRVLGRTDEAAAAFRGAIEAWPGAQAARVALMTLQVSRGERQEAAALAESVQASADTDFDPWWVYPLGDFRLYPAIVTKLRDLAK